MSELSRKVTELGSRLAELSENGFRALGRAKVGARLARVSLRIAALVPEEESAQWRALCERLVAFDSLERDLQTVEVARGLRLCRQVGGFGSARKRRREPGDTESLPGIGPTLAARLAERGLTTVEDLAWWMPRRYEDARFVSRLDALSPDAVSPDVGAIQGRVLTCRFVRLGRRRWVDLRLSGLDDSDCRMVVRWFHAHGGMADKFPVGAVASLAGTVRVRKGQLEMANPHILAVIAEDATGDEKPGRILLRYPEIPGVPGRTLEKACRAAVSQVAHTITDPVPAEIATRIGLPSLAEALTRLHHPADNLPEQEVAALNAGESPWHRRLAFGELFLLALAVARRRQAVRTGEAPACAPTAGLAEELARALPFSMTGAQERSFAAISRDLAGPGPMNRLLQGDVGSGKTAVIFAAALQVVRAGAQVALMAPTEILAEQHLATLLAWGQPLGLRLALLSASRPKAVRASMASLLLAGEIDIVVGTHALLSESVAFRRLGLVVVDEQHRFGVAQRVRLREKGGEQPHLLVATATPIPRTLALTAYGDLDVSVLDEMPPGRSPVVTEVVHGDAGRRQAYDVLKRTLAEGQRAFVICPLVEPPEDDLFEVADATTVHEKLTQALPDAAVGLVHGRQPTEERGRVMDGFRNGDIKVLVSTTVVEVGVDVPEATLMLVMDADRFGLAQLHQLRGRVGRGKTAARCFLVTRGQHGDTTMARLGAMAETNDGFRIADVDLALRGPGELLGARQAGLPRLRFGDLSAHTELLVQARSEAEELLAEDPELEEHPDVRLALEARLKDAQAYGAEGG